MVRRRKVFICYSRRDENLRKALFVHLEPLAYEHGVELWLDQRTGPGDEWKPKILSEIARADAVLALVSPNFLKSEFIRDEEIPRFLTAYETRDLLLAPLFLRHSNVTKISYQYTGSEGNGQKKLTEFQGLNGLDEPIEDEKGNINDAALAEAARKFFERLGNKATAPPPRRELDIELKLRNGDVVRTYHLPGRPAIDQGRGQIDFRQLEGQDPANTALGDRLFQHLLGDEAERLRVMELVLGRDGRDPLIWPLRIRIHTSEARLRALPWYACCWLGRRLIDEGWSFELCSGAPEKIVHLETPCRALLVSGQPPGFEALGVNAHGASMAGTLEGSWNLAASRFLHRATHLQDLDRELTQRPTLLYLFLHAREGADGKLLLLLPDGEGGTVELSFLDLVGRLAAPLPKIIVLATVGQVPLAPPIPGVAVFLHLRHPQEVKPLRHVALYWWNSVLGLEVNPVRAALDFSGRHGVVATLYTGFREWHMEHSDFVSKAHRVRAHLDRRDQRRLVMDEVDTLVSKPERRVTCLVAYAAEGNLVQHFAEQVSETLKEKAADRVRLHPEKPRLPEERHGLTAEQIRDQFRDGLGISPEEDLLTKFRQVRFGGPSATPVTFLDWGTFGPGRQAPLLGRHLEEWVKFCFFDLEGDVLILSYLCLVSPAERHTDLLHAVHALKKKYHARHFDLVAVPALSEVDADDLLRFLEDRQNSTCPLELLETLPDRIIRKTGGVFDQTVRFLEEAEKGYLWPELDEELPKAEPRPAFDGDIEL